jgi:hypothetical protein
VSDEHNEAESFHDQLIADVQEQRRRDREIWERGLEIPAKDKAAVLLEVAKIFDSRYKTRLDYQWKINLFLWAGLSAMLASDIHSRIHVALPVMIVAFVLLAGVYIHWTVWVRRRHLSNLIGTVNCTQQALRLMNLSSHGPDEVSPRNHPSSRFVSHSSILEITTTLVLIALNILIWFH